MASAGVSRSGRVRKKSAKLIEMEIESNPHINTSALITTDNCSQHSIKITPIVGNNAINISATEDNIKPLHDNSIEETLIKSDSDSGKPLKKKLKIKLPMNTTPVITSDASKTDEKLVLSSNNGEECVDSSLKKVTIPPLKIPKSKITGLAPNITPEVDVKEMKPIIESNLTQTPVNSVTKTKKVKNQTNKTEIIESKAKTIDSMEVENEVIESIPKVEVEVETPIRVGQLFVAMNDKPIEETPKLKVLKPKKKEQESAANKLFRQITSGVAVTPKGKGNKRNKSLPLEDVTQISFDDEFEETSLIIETEEEKTKTKPKNKRSRPTKTSNDNKKEEKKPKRGKSVGNEEKPKKKRNAVITAYMIWSKEHRIKIQQTSPDLDFADVSRKLGEIWQSMPEKDRIPWRRKAQKLVGKGSSIISTGKPKAVAQTPKLNTNSVTPVVNNDDYSSYTSIDDLWQPVGTSPMDVSAHLTLLGESLSTIGQRLKEHSGQIAVSGSLSVLLDSTLCAIGPLLCLTQLDPNLDGCTQEMHKKTLDNIAYIMPGI